MKKIVQSIVVRAVCTLIFGILLIIFSESITEWIVRICGIAFIVPGMVALISHFHKDPETKQVMLYPIIGAGSILFGLVLLIWPTLFVEAMLYILATVLILVAATQCYTLWNIRRGGISLNWAYYFLPVAELAIGIWIILSNEKATIGSIPIMLIGCGFIVYALLELWTVFLLKRSGVQALKRPETETVSENQH